MLQMLVSMRNLDLCQISLPRTWKLTRGNCYECTSEAHLMSYYSPAHSNNSLYWCFHVFPSGHRSNASPLTRTFIDETTSRPLPPLPTHLSARHRRSPRCAFWYLTINTYPLGWSHRLPGLCNLWFVMQIISYEVDLTGMQKIIDRVSSQKKMTDSSGTGHQWDSIK
jgi:hypothetical protein